MKKYFMIVALSFGRVSSGACGDNRMHSHGVYMLVDTSGTYAHEMGKAAKIVNYLLATLNPGDSPAVAKVGSRSYTEKDIVAKVTFDKRPSQATSQKRVFKDKIQINFGFGLEAVYAIWIMIVVALYPLCRGYQGYKEKNPSKWWLSYL